MIELYSLLSHLKNCPDVFLESSVQFEGGSIHTEALIADCYRLVSGNPLLNDDTIPDRYQFHNLNEVSITAIHIGCWLFSHKYFHNKPELSASMGKFMFELLPQLASLVDNKLWIDDEDRNEEFVRLALDCCDLLPAGESKNEAADRLEALSTIKRQQVLKASAEAFERILEIRRKMAEQKAREAANVYGRE